MTQSSKHTGSQSQAIDALDFQAPGAAKPEQQTRSSKSESTASRGAGLLAARSDAPWWHSQFNLMLAVFGLLMAAALIFILLSPAPDAQRYSTIVNSDGTQADSSAEVVGAAEQGDQATPFDESRNQQARGDSQDVLSELLRTKSDLESREVSIWAKADFDAAIALAEEGDQFYSRRDFVAAQTAYENAVKNLKALSERIPAVIAGFVSEGQAAIDSGKSQLAKNAFNNALKVDPNNISALGGLDRANSLDQVLQILRDAGEDEQAFSSLDQVDLLDSAKAKYEQALQIDGSTQAAQTGLTRIAGLREDKSYRDAMTQGFNALFNRRFSAAKQGFSNALKVRPNDETALAAYRQSLASDSRASISSLLASAKQFEQQEQWSSALGNYQTVLQRDPNQVTAKVGQVRSTARLDLDQSIKALLDDPLAVAKSDVREQMQSALNDARALSNKGSRIKSQIDSLQTVLQQADAEMKVELSSDGLTDISLSREGTRRIKLGKFTVRKLALKPGRYVLTGSRLGYRDVRKNIELRSSGEAVQNFYLACTEPVAQQDSASDADVAALN